MKWDNIRHSITHSGHIHKNVCSTINIYSYVDAPLDINCHSSLMDCAKMTESERKDMFLDDAVALFSNKNNSGSALKFVQ